MSELGRFQARVVFVYGAALTLRGFYGSGVAGMHTKVCYSIAYLRIFEFFEF